MQLQFLQLQLVWLLVWLRLLLLLLLLSLLRGQTDSQLWTKRALRVTRGLNTCRPAGVLQLVDRKKDLVKLAGGETASLLTLSFHRD